MPTHGGPLAKFVPLFVASLNSQSEKVSGMVVAPASGPHAATVEACTRSPLAPSARASPKLTSVAPESPSTVLVVTLM